MKKLESEAVRKNKIITQLTRNVDKTEKSLMKMKDFKKKILIAAGLTSPNALKEIVSGGGPIVNVSPDVELMHTGSKLTPGL